MTDLDKENVIQQVLQDGSIAAPLLEDGSPFLLFLSRVREAYTEMMFATRANEKELREEIYTRMNVLDDILNTVTIARDQSRILSDRLAEEDENEDDKE